MQILVNDPVQQTIIFGAIFFVAFLISFIPKKNYTPLSRTQELKGFAILTIIFGHIGYFLSVNQEFLFPLSVLSGVGVNLFFFLSGYGLTFSQLKKSEGIFSFYTKRLTKLFVPFWIVLGILFLMDFFILGKVYTASFTLSSFFGIFTQANMLTDFNSPLWYFSLILLYYLLFPLLFSKKRPWLTALYLYVAVWLLVYINPSSLSGVIGLYQVHLWAFPLGVFFAWLIFTKKSFFERYKDIYIRNQRYLYPIVILSLLGSIGYLAIHSNVGEVDYIEQATSIITMFAILLLFLVKKRESKLFSLFGFFSYEIYLFHWPFLSQYDFLYTHFPGWFATLTYLVFFILIAMVLRKLSDFIFSINAK
jgi:peptidoglycan/LPS O-acetylase OafA/YrhL